jgi:6-phosphofructokinase 1
MVTLNRNPGAAYATSFGQTALERVAFKERLFPLDWIDSAGTGVLPVFQAYAAPLIGEVQAHAELFPVTPRELKRDE